MHKALLRSRNGGISRDAELVNIGVMDKENMVKFAKDNAIDLVFVAPDDAC